MKCTRVHCAVYVIKTRFQLRSRSHALLVGRSDVQQLERRLYITPCIFLTFTLSIMSIFYKYIYIYSYITEPPTSGKVLLETTHGDVEIELWCKEAPIACRNFVQLCMEG